MGLGKKILLSIPTLLYGIVVGIRNFLFDIKVLKSHSFDFPVICIGNLTVGGTGKTPMVEYIISEIEQKYKIACLSRGYKRKTKGFIIANEGSKPEQIGDEPFQIKRKFRNIIMACDADRVRGIKKLIRIKNSPDVIILDDAYQHRYVDAGKKILLIDYNRPIYEDNLMPMGMLRESIKGKYRADYIVVTKCPMDIKPIEKRIIEKHIKPKPYQKIFFSGIKYGEIESIGNNTAPPKGSKVLCITGIANPNNYITHLETEYKFQLEHINFPDHHWFTKKDWKTILKKLKETNTEYIMTTEKDFVRMDNIPKEITDKIFYIPIKPFFLDNNLSIIHELDEYIRQTKICKNKTKGTYRYK